MYHSTAYNFVNFYRIGKSKKHQIEAEQVLFLVIYNT